MFRFLNQLNFWMNLGSVVSCSDAKYECKHAQDMVLSLKGQ
jgi:hypothetical protein